MHNFWGRSGTRYYLPVSESDSESDLGQCHRDWRLQVGKCEMPAIEEHGGYYCAGCKQSWFSLCSLIYHRASPAMCGTDCEREESSTAAGPELRNVYSSNLASGLELRSPIIPAGTSTLLCILCCIMWIAPWNLKYIQHALFKPPALPVIESIGGTVEKVLRSNRV